MFQKSIARFCAVLVLTLLCFFSFQNTNAYDEHTTHPALTGQIVDFYNLLHPGAPFTSEEKEWIVQGSILEDTPPRWINHFYDPVNKVSWTGEHTGNIPADAVVIFRALALSPEPPLMAVDWVNNQAIQNEYSLYGGDRTWKRGLKYYADGNRKEAYVTLGHVLHLMEDMTVPEHTRNDPHAHDVEKVTGDYGSPYEEYAKKWTRDTLHIAEDIKRGGFLPPAKPSIEDYLTSAAEYSNHFFFSKDTINDPKYPLPKIVREDGNFGYGIDEKGIEFPLVKIDKIWNEKKKEYEAKYLLQKSEPAYYPILDAYFSRLSRQAVLHGAGAVDLFLMQAKDAVVNKEYPQHLVVLDAAKITLPIFSPFGELVKAWNALASLAGRAAEAAQKSISSLASIPNFFRRGGANISSNFQGGGNSPTILGNETAGVQTAPLPENKNIPSAAPKTAGPKTPAILPPRVSTILPPPRPDSVKPEAADNSGGGVQAPFTSVQKENVLSSGGGGGVTISLASAAPASAFVPLAAAVDATSTNTTSTGSGSSSSGSSGGSASSTAEASASPYHFRASYVSSSMTIAFEWDTATGTDIGSSTARYEISQIFDATSTFLGETTSTSFSKIINEVGTTSTFMLAVLDGAGAERGTSSKSIWIPSFLDALHTYRDPRAPSTQYLFDLFYSSYPFIPPIWSKPTYGAAMWQGIVFYLNRLPNKENQILTDGGVNLTDGVLSFRRGWPAVGVIFGLSPERSNGIGGGLNNSTALLPEEDGHFVVSPALSTDDRIFGPSDFFTVAYYDFSRSGGGRQDLSFVAADDTKYYFESSPAWMRPPNPPAAIGTAFDAFHSTIGITWASSTDPDSPDASLTYEFQLATSSVFDAATWQPMGINLQTAKEVVFGNEYVIGVRAIDGFGNISAPAAQAWNFPAGYSPLPAQSAHPGPIGYISSDPNVLIGQKFRMTRDGRIDAIALWVENGGGITPAAETYLELRNDDGGVIGEVIATSTSASIPSAIYAINKENAYLFIDAPVALAANFSYWIVAQKGPSDSTNASRIWGIGDDIYADGFWSPNPRSDAYFRLREAP